MTSLEVFSLVLNILLLFFNCKSNPRRLHAKLRRLRNNFQKTSIEVFPEKSFTKSQISDKLWSIEKLICLSDSLGFFWFFLIKER